MMLRIGEVADRLGLSVEHVRRLTNTGELSCTRTAGGHRRFPEDDVAAFEAGHGPGQPQPPPPVQRPRPHVRHRPYTPIFDDYPEETEYVGELREHDDDEWQEPDVEPKHAPTRTRRPRAATPPADRIVPPPSVASPSVDDAEEREAAENAREEAARLQNLKNLGMAHIPYDVPPRWHAKVVAELEHRVTAQHIPPWVPSHEQHTVVRGVVEDVLQPYHDEIAQQKARKEAEAAKAKAKAAAKEEATRQIQALINHGTSYANRELREFDTGIRWKVRRDVEEALKEEVKADWGEEDVEELVDEVLDEWEEEDE